MKDKTQLIAELLIDATENVLIKSVEDWLNNKHPNTKLTCRVGSGKRTYHRKISENQSIIVYGKKMIELKLKSYRNCSLWLSSKEIIERNYFEGKLTIQNALCGVIMHETAHYFQSLAGYRNVGSVHNDAFYRILDRMHFNGATQKVYDFLNKHELFRELEFENKEDTHNSESFNIFNKNDLKIGDFFYFKSRSGAEIIETVVKLNPKKVKGVNYTVPYSLITRIETDPSKINSDLLQKLPDFNNKNLKKGDKIYFKSKSGEIISDTVQRTNLKNAVCLKYIVPYSIIISLN